MLNPRLIWKHACAWRHQVLGRGGKCFWGTLMKWNWEAIDSIRWVRTLNDFMWFLIQSGAASLPRIQIESKHLKYFNLFNFGSTFSFWGLSLPQKKPPPQSSVLKLGLSPLPGCQSPPGLWNIFRIGDPKLNLHLPQASWEGGQPNLKLSLMNFHWFSHNLGASESCPRHLATSGTGGATVATAGRCAVFSFFVTSRVGGKEVSLGLMMVISDGGDDGCTFDLAWYWMCIVTSVTCEVVGISSKWWRSPASSIRYSCEKQDFSQHLFGIKKAFDGTGFADQCSLPIN